MDAKTFGTFLAQVRREKGMTQADVAERLHVTAKAVSKWERGAGLPDIHTLEPLAETLELSLVELMRSERSEAVDQAAASAALSEGLQLAVRQKEQERRRMLELVMVAGFLELLLFLGPMGVLAAFLPCFCLLAGPALLLYGLWRRRGGLPAGAALAVGGGLTAVPLLLAVLLFFSGALGLGPVPNEKEKRRLGSGHSSGVLVSALSASTRRAKASMEQSSTVSPGRITRSKKQLGISRLRSSFSMHKEHPWLWFAGWHRQAVFRQGQKWPMTDLLSCKNPRPSGAGGCLSNVRPLW